MWPTQYVPAVQGSSVPPVERKYAFCADSVNRVFNLPFPDVEDGDLVFMVVNYTGNNAIPNPPAGWLKVIRGNDGNDRPTRVSAPHFTSSFIYYKIWRPGDITNYNVTYVSGTAWLSGCVYVYGNVDQDRPIDFLRITDQNTTGVNLLFADDLDANDISNVRLAFLFSRDFNPALTTDAAATYGGFEQVGECDLSTNGTTGKIVRVLEKRFPPAEFNYAHNLFPRCALDAAEMYGAYNANVWDSGAESFVACNATSTNTPHYIYVDRELEVGTYTWQIFHYIPYAPAYYDIHFYLTITEPDNNEFGSWYNNSGTFLASIGTGFTKNRSSGLATSSMVNYPRCQYITFTVTKPGVHRFKFGLGTNASNSITWQPGWNPTFYIAWNGLVKGEVAGPLLNTTGTSVDNPGSYYGLVCPFITPDSISWGTVSLEIRAAGSPTVPTKCMRLPQQFTSHAVLDPNRMAKQFGGTFGNDPNQTLVAARGFDVYHHPHKKVYWEITRYRIAEAPDTSPGEVRIDVELATGMQQGFMQLLSGNTYATHGATGYYPNGEAGSSFIAPTFSNSAWPEESTLAWASRNSHMYWNDGGSDQYWDTVAYHPRWYSGGRSGMSFTIGVGLDWDAKQINYYVDGQLIGTLSANISRWTHNQIHPVANFNEPAGSAMNMMGFMNFAGPFFGRKPAGYVALDDLHEVENSVQLVPSVSSVNGISTGTSDQTYTINVNMDGGAGKTFILVADFPRRIVPTDVTIDSVTSSAVTLRGHYRFKGTYDQLVAADGAIAYYKFDETSGTVATDSIGGYHGTYVGTVTYDAASLLPGWIARSVNLVSGSYVRIDNPPQLPSSWTIEYWEAHAYQTNYVNTGFSCADSTGANYAIVDYVDVGNYRSSSYVRTTVGTGYMARRSYAGTHKVMSYNHLTKQFRIWSNGRLTLNVADNGDDFFARYVDGNLIAQSGSWYLGVDYRTLATTPKDFINGRVNALAVYNKAFTQEEALRHFKHGSNGGSTSQTSTDTVMLYAYEVPSNLETYNDLVLGKTPVNYWKMDGTLSNEVNVSNPIQTYRDPSLRRRSVTKLWTKKSCGTREWGKDFFYGSHGVSNAVPFTIEFWYRCHHGNNQARAYVDHYPFALDSLDGSNHAVWFTVDVYDGAWYSPSWFAHSASGSTYTLRCQSVGGEIPNFENHAAFTYDPVSKVVRAYLNGTQRSAATMNNILKFMAPEFSLGCAMRTTDKTNAWGHATVDYNNIAIYPRVLSAEEILAHYNKGNLCNWGIPDTYNRYFSKEIPVTFRWDV